MALPHRLVAGALLLLAAHAAAEPPPVASGDLTELSLEDLMEVEITSVSKRAQKLADTPAAVTVISQEDLRRSGATSLAEALRMVPGMQVAQISANRWAVSSRGFNDAFANKLLVMVDGRTVYTPLFSGVFWDVQDVMLEDVQRIEVIRGPGATLWGANAVNGVINVITRSAEDTQGGLVTGGLGNEERGFGGFRYGMKVAEDAHLRVWGRYFDRGSYETPDGHDARDQWDLGRGGFRMDWDSTQRDLLTFQGDYYDGDVGAREQLVTSLVPASTPVVAQEGDVRGGNGLARWTHRFEGGSETSLQGYWDRSERESLVASEQRDTFDLDFQHQLPVGSRQEVVWGLGYRYTADETDGSLSVFFDPERRSDDLVSGFLQDEIWILEERLSLTLGSKFEHNDYTGFEWQPSGRLLFKPRPDHTLWSAVSRAVRTPSRAEDDALIRQLVTNEALNTGPPFFLNVPFTSVVQIEGDDGFESERLMAYEAGWRWSPSARASLDLAAFYDDYAELRGIQLAGTDASALMAFLGSFTPLTGPGVVTTLRLDNRFAGHTYGTELAGHLDVTDRWRLSGSWSWLRTNLSAISGTTDPSTAETVEGGSPTHQLQVRSRLDLPRGFELDGALYWVENLPAYDVASYVRLDLRLGWKVRDDLTLSLVVQNALDGHHEEFGDSSLFWPRSVVERGVYGKVDWRF
jgi:iron complex outermembrane receptor protein